MIRLSTSTTQTINFIPREGVVNSIVLENEATKDSYTAFQAPYLDFDNAFRFSFDIDYNELSPTLQSGEEAVTVINGDIFASHKADYDLDVASTALYIPILELVEDSNFSLTIDNTLGGLSYAPSLFLLGENGSFNNAWSSPIIFGLFQNDRIKHNFNDLNISKDAKYLSVGSGYIEPNTPNLLDDYWAVLDFTINSDNITNSDNYTEVNIALSEGFLQEGQTYTLKALDSSSNVLFYDKVFCTDQTDYTINKDEFKSYSQSETYKTFKG